MTEEINLDKLFDLYFKHQVLRREIAALEAERKTIEADMRSEAFCQSKKIIPELPNNLLTSNERVKKTLDGLVYTDKVSLYVLTIEETFPLIIQFIPIAPITRKDS